MITFLIAFAAFCIGNYVGRQDGILEGRKEVLDELDDVENDDINEILHKNWPDAEL